MRQIKFRSWDERNNRFFETIKTIGDEYFFGINSKGLVFERYLGQGSWENLPLQQFTGLLDKNGKEIYEGDVVFSEKLNAHAEVRYGNAHFFIIGGTAAQPLVVAGWELSPNAHGIEIIGNIYEHPNLLN